MSREVSSKRSSRINIRISPETHDRLKRIADKLAMPPTTVAAFALSDWLAQKELQQEMINKATEIMAHDLVKSDEIDDAQIDLFKNLIESQK